MPEKTQEEQTETKGLPESKTKFCSECGEKISDKANACPKCGATQPGADTERKSRTVAILLAIFIPGTGQMYAGEFGKGLLIFCTSWLVIPWLYGIYDAVKRKDLK